MRVLHRKLWRDLVRLWAQVLTIALVVACGVAGFVGAFSTHRSLEGARDAYYREARFADVFAGVRRAPATLRADLAAIAGVADVQLDTVFDTQLDLAGAEQPLTGRIVALDIARPPRVNRLSLRTGRWPARGSAGAAEVLVNDRFATLRGLKPGSTLVALLNGRREALTIVGTATTPEYVFASRGSGPDDEWFGIVWMDAERVAAAFGMEGAFNHAALRLVDGARAAAVIAATDRLLDAYGSVGAVGRDQQLSALVVDNELKQQQVLGTVLPAIFLAVAVFILNVVVGRQVATQRQQIAALKALGYRDGEIAAHYIGLAVAIAVLGIVLGLAGGRWLGGGMVLMYQDVFRFGRLEYRTVPGVVGVAVVAVLAAAVLGAFAAIRAVVTLPPAQAMQPPTPPVFRPMLLERLGRGDLLPPAARMVVRNIERRPARALLTIAGIGAAVALQVSGLFWSDTIARIVDVQYRQVLQCDVLIDFANPVDEGVVADLRRLPGVVEAQVWRSEPVRVRAGPNRIDTVLLGRGAGAQNDRLMRVVDTERGARAVPAEGVALSGLLARALGVRVGDRVEVEFRLWNRRSVELPVAEVVRTMFGREAYMALPAMNRIAGDGAGVTNAALQIDPHEASDFYAALKSTPAVSAVFDKGGSMRSFEKTTARNIGWFTGVLTLFAVAMAVGITYNAARISLAERAWELASLRVLGMTRAEVSVLLLSELGALLLIALPVGALLGRGLAELLVRAMASDQIDFPVVVDASTYGIAALTVVAAGVASAAIVRRRIDRLDLVAVLKVRE